MNMRRWLLLSLLTPLLLTASGRADAQQGPSLAVDPPAQTVALQDGPFDVHVTVDDVTNEAGLGGYTLVMAYDPQLLRALTITDSGLVGSTGNAALCPASAIDNDGGRLAHFCFTIPLFVEPGPLTSEPAVLVTVRFEPVAEGATTLDISDSSIIDPQGNGLAATTSNGEVTVRLPPARPTERPPAEPTPTASSEAGAGRPGLPAAGGRPEAGTGRHLLDVAFMLLGIGGAAALAVALVMRRRERAS